MNSQKNKLPRARRLAGLILSETLLAAAVICVVCDRAVFGRLTWSLIVALSLLLTWAVARPPCWCGERAFVFPRRLQPGCGAVSLWAQRTSRPSGADAADRAADGGGGRRLFMAGGVDLFPDPEQMECRCPLPARGGRPERDRQRHFGGAARGTVVRCLGPVERRAPPFVRWRAVRRGPPAAPMRTHHCGGKPREIFPRLFIFCLTKLFSNVTLVTLLKGDMPQ